MLKSITFYLPAGTRTELHNTEHAVKVWIHNLPDAIHELRQMLGEMEDADVRMNSLTLGPQGAAGDLINVRSESE